MEYLTFTRDIHSLYSKNITIVEVLKTNIYVGDEGPFWHFSEHPQYFGLDYLLQLYLNDKTWK